MGRYRRKRSEKLASIICNAIFIIEAMLVALVALIFDQLKVNIWLGWTGFAVLLFLCASSVLPIKRFVNKHFAPEKDENEQNLQVKQGDGR